MHSFGASRCSIWRQKLLRCVSWDVISRHLRRRAWTRKLFSSRVRWQNYEQRVRILLHAWIWISVQLYIFKIRWWFGLSQFARISNGLFDSAVKCVSMRERSVKENNLMWNLAAIFVHTRLINFCFARQHAGRETYKMCTVCFRYLYKISYFNLWICFSFKSELRKYYKLTMNNKTMR